MSPCVSKLEAVPTVSSGSDFFLAKFFEIFRRMKTRAKIKTRITTDKQITAINSPVDLSFVFVSVDPLLVLS